jgi:hypothetical protein
MENKIGGSLFLNAVAKRVFELNNDEDLINKAKLDHSQNMVKKGDSTHDLQKCSFCNLWMDREDDAIWICGWDEVECSRWCQQDFCKHNLQLCKLCGYGVCPDHSFGCVDCENLVCKNCSDGGFHKCENELKSI